MSNLSTVTIEGNVTQDPLMKKTKTGKEVCNFSLAIHHGDSNAEGSVSFIDVETWENVARSCNERLTKGKRVMVMGSLRQERWQATDGKQRSRIKVIGNQVRYLMSKKDESSLGTIPVETGMHQ